MVKKDAYGWSIGKTYDTKIRKSYSTGKWKLMVSTKDNQTWTKTYTKKKDALAESRSYLKAINR